MATLLPLAPPAAAHHGCDTTWNESHTAYTQECHQSGSTADVCGGAHGRRVDHRWTNVPIGDSNQGLWHYQDCRRGLDAHGVEVFIHSEDYAMCTYDKAYLLYTCSGVSFHSERGIVSCAPFAIAGTHAPRQAGIPLYPSAGAGGPMVGSPHCAILQHQMQEQYASILSTLHP